MKRSALSLAFAIMIGGCRSGLSDSEMLMQCWEAAPSERPGEYRLKAEVIIFPGVEGDASARSRRCRDHRLHLRAGNAGIAARFDDAAASVEPLRALGAGVRLSARVAVEERTSEHHMTVVVRQVYGWQPMTPAETDRFIKAFKIG